MGAGCLDLGQARVHHVLQGLDVGVEQVQLERVFLAILAQIAFYNTGALFVPLFQKVSRLRQFPHPEFVRSANFRGLQFDNGIGFHHWLLLYM